jgi:polysaccharide export outer membrane protein
MKAMTGKNNVFRLVNLAGLFLAAVVAFSGCASAPVNQAANQAAGARAENITLREGDVVKIAFPGSASLDSTQPIRRDGKVALPMIGEVAAAGLTPEELQKKLIELYASQIDTKVVTVTLQSSSFPVFVTGAVLRPGKIMSDHPISALEAVMESGGFNYATANMKAVRIIRHENGAVKNFTVDLSLALSGKNSTPFYLRPSDIVYVPEHTSMF